MPTSFAQWWSAIARHRMIAMLSFVVVIFLTACVILFSTRSYRSTSRLLLRIGHENATLDPTVAITGDTITPHQTREDEVETALGVMQSRSILEEVVDRVGIQQILSETPPSVDQATEEPPGLLSQITGPLKEKLRNIDPVSDRETAIRTLEGGLDISAPSKSSVVTVQYKSEHPLVAQNIVSAWVESYLVQHSKVNRTQGTYAFFSEQDEALKAQLDEAHLALRTTKTDGGFATLEGQQKMLEAQLEKVRTELLTVAGELAESSSRAKSVGEMLTSVIDATMTEEVRGLANEAHDDMRGRLFQLEVLENEYAAKYKDSHPKLVVIRDQLADARKIVESQDTQRSEVRESANPTYQQLSENRLIDIAAQQALEDKRKVLIEQRDKLLDEIKQLNEYEEEMARLSRNVETLEERYKLHSIRLEQSRLDELLEERKITSINVIQPASLEQRPVTPNKKLCAAMGLFAALAVALSLPVLVDVRTHESADQQPLATPPLHDVMSARDASAEPVASSVVKTNAEKSLGSEPVVGSSSRPR